MSSRHQLTCACAWVAATAIPSCMLGLYDVMLCETYCHLAYLCNHSGPSLVPTCRASAQLSSRLAVLCRFQTWKLSMQQNWRCCMRRVQPEQRATFARDGSGLSCLQTCKLKLRFSLPCGTVISACEQGLYSLCMPGCTLVGVCNDSLSIPLKQKRLDAFCSACVQWDKGVPKR